MTGTGGGGQIGWAAGGEFVGQDSESNGFLGVRIDAVTGGSGQGEAGQEFAEAAHDLAVVDASTGGDHLADFFSGDGVGDGLRGELSGRGDEIVYREPG